MKIFGNENKNIYDVVENSLLITISPKHSILHLTTPIILARIVPKNRANKTPIRSSALLE